MQAIFNRPMAADGLSQQLRIGGITRQEVANLGLHLAAAVDATNSLDCQHGTQPWPVAQRLTKEAAWERANTRRRTSLMAFIEGIEHRFGDSTTPKIVLLEMTLYRCIQVVCSRLSSYDQRRTGNTA